MNRRVGLIVVLVGLALAPGCADKPKPYGYERQLIWVEPAPAVWAVAPAVNLSGQRDVDPLLQGDLLYQQLQQVHGITAIPVNRVAEVYTSLRIERVQSAEQAALVCDLLGCDGLIVPTVTIYDPYNPPKFGAAVQLFRPKGTVVRQAALDVRDLARRAAPGANESLPRGGDFNQAVGMFDAANGTVRDALIAYADGRHDPKGPLGSKEYFVSMDRFCGFAFYSLLQELLESAATK